MADPETDSPTTEHLKIQWHLSRDLLSVATYSSNSGGFVGFFTKKGGKAFFLSNVRPNYKPTCICWHSSEPILAVGWTSLDGRNGLLTFVDPFEKSEVDVTELQNIGPVCFLLWDSKNSNLLVLDMKGNAKVIQFDRSAPVQKQRTLIGSNKVGDEIPNNACHKLVTKQYLRQSHSAGANPKNSKKETRISPGPSVESRPSSGFAELLKKYKKNADFVIENEPTSALPTSDLISVYLIATKKGGIYVFEPISSQMNRIFQVDSSVRQILDIPSRLTVVIITEGMMFYLLGLEGRIANDRIKVKLTGQGHFFFMISIDASTMAQCYGEHEIRIWDLEAEDSAVFRLSTEKGYEPTENITNICYSSKKGTIFAVTTKSRLASWRRIRKSKSRRDDRGIDLPIDQQWYLSAPISLNAKKIIDIAFSHTSTAFAVNSGDLVDIFLPNEIEFCFESEYVILQMGTQALTLLKISDPTEIQEMQFPYMVKGFHLTPEKNFLLWDEQSVQLTEINYSSNAPTTIKTISSFNVANVIKATYNAGQLYAFANDELMIYTVQGTLKKKINFQEIEDKPEVIAMKGTKWMCVGTAKGYLRVYDISEGNLKLSAQSLPVSKDVDGGFQRFQSIQVNTAGNRVSFTIQTTNEEIHEKLFVWDAETNSIGFFSFHSGITDQQYYEQVTAGQMGLKARAKSSVSERPKTAAIRKIESEQIRYKMPLHFPGNHFWDDKDPRFLVCEAVTSSEALPEQFVLTMFVTCELGIQVQIELTSNEDEEIERNISNLILRKTIREFVGVDPNDEIAINAMLNFSFYLSAGQMDNAFKAIKFIKNESVWEHLAKMCVKTRKIDVARVCLGHVGNARAARAIRQSMENDEPIEIQTARLAIELGMIDEAMRIYMEAKRYDMANRLYQSQGKWNEAFDIAEKHDRIHLRHTYYNFAKYLESNNAIDLAIENYEKSNTEGFEVPRMLCDVSEPNSRELKVLELYVKQKGTLELYKWWAQYLESFNDLDMAKNFYMNARDYLSVVRILCYREQIQEAKEIIDFTKDRSAAFHLGLHFETTGDFNSAVAYYEKADAYSSAIRLAKEHKMTDKLANLALMGGNAELLEAAEFYKDLPGHADKAVMLYHKAGMIGRALDYAFRTEQFGALDLIANDLSEKSDPIILERAAEFFSANQRDKMAVQLLSYAKKYNEAVKICLQKNVLINEQLDNLLTPKKEDNFPNVEKLKLLEAVARCCLQQGNYHLAAKKFTQAGNKLDAMKSLIKSGDASKIILFANTARNQDIYRLAGNYLQTLNWKEDAELVRKIEHYYLKANAVESLANFYESCAQIEVDEFKDYEKALSAYKEALRYLGKRPAKRDNVNGGGVKLETSRRIAEREEEMHRKIATIEEFLEIKVLHDSDPGEAMRRLTDMAKRSGINDVIRVGDIYAIIILHNVRRSNFRKAWQLVEECEHQKPKVDLRLHLEQHTLDQICDNAGVPRMKFEDNEINGDETGEEFGVEYSHALKRMTKNLD